MLPGANYHQDRDFVKGRAVLAAPDVTVFLLALQETTMHVHAMPA